jgi:hypothetical protein
VVVVSIMILWAKIYRLGFYFGFEGHCIMPPKGVKTPFSIEKMACFENFV